jgi:hypothetical protein
MSESNKLSDREKLIVGRNVLIDFVGYAAQIPAKVDTGADNSSVWASGISVNSDGALQFQLFAPGSQFFTGQIITRNDFQTVKVRNSTGHTQIRYQTQLTVRIKGRKIRGTFVLADRSKNFFPVLLGRKILNRKFVVDVAKYQIKEPAKKPSSSDLPPDSELNQQLRDNPVQFHKNYIERSHQ